MLITPEYRKLNADLHEANPAYGTTAKKYVRQVYDLAQSMNAETVLDYGAGKGLLREGIANIRKGLPGDMVAEYDPCIPEKNVRPAPADLVVSIDVMEHIEPDCLDDVLQDICRLANKAVFLTIATRPAVKTLADGRNAHLIVESVDWWLPRLMRFFSPRLLHVGEGEIVFLGLPKAVPAEQEQAA